MKRKDLKFAISLSGGIKEWVSALKIVDSSPFDKVELPGACMDDNLKSPDCDILKNFPEDKRTFEVVSVTDIAPATISGEIADQNSAIIDNFIKNIRISLDKLERIGIAQGTLNISPENAFENEEKHVKQIKLLKQIIPTLSDKRLKLSIPVRIPSVNNTDPGNFPAFLRETMSPNIKLAIKVHPHEIKNQNSPENLLQPFRFLMTSISFVYEPEAGNLLVDKLLDPWLNILEKHIFPGIVVFVPRTANIAIFNREVERLSGIIAGNGISSS